MLRLLQDDYVKKEKKKPTLGHVPLTKGLQSHSMRRGTAQWAKASFKIATQYLCSRGMWTMDALSKAFAYVGTTLTKDQTIAKRLSGWLMKLLCPHWVFVWIPQDPKSLILSLYFKPKPSPHAPGSLEMNPSATFNRPFKTSCWSLFQCTSLKR